MEPIVNITKLQGIFIYFSESIGDLTKINYKDGNEQKFLKMVENLKSYLNLSSFLIGDEANTENFKELEYVTALFLINTQFKEVTTLSSLKQYSHFVKAIPAISKCVLANFIIELDLIQHLCSLSLKLPDEIVVEVFEELSNIFKQGISRKQLYNSYNILSTIITKLTIINEENKSQTESSEVQNKLSNIAENIIKNFVDITEKWAHKMKSGNENKGYMILYFFKLLRSCSLDTICLNQIIQTLINGLVCLIMSVNVIMFCDWAEIPHEDNQPLQIVIANEAYMVLEHLVNYKPAKTLIEMLNTIAKKPKTINELIFEADMETLIANIDRCDNNQQLWFRGLINRNIFRNESALDCVDRWAHLCTKVDIMQILRTSLPDKDMKSKLLILKCCSALKVQDLEYVSTQYFTYNNSNYLDTGCVVQEFNNLMKASPNNTEEEFLRGLYLLLLQNPEILLTAMYHECLKSTACTTYLKTAFTSIKVCINVIHGLATTCFLKVMNNNPVTSENVICYKALLDMLLELKYLSTPVILNEIFKPQLQDSLNKKSYEMLLHQLQLLNTITTEYVLQDQILGVISLLSNILEKTRPGFSNFSLICANITEEVVDYLRKYRILNSLQQNTKIKDYLEQLEVKNVLNRYHITSLYQHQDATFLTCICPQLKICGNIENDVAVALKILPYCVTLEWKLAVKEIHHFYNNYQKLLELLESTLILLSKTVIQADDSTLCTALKYYVQQYGTVIKEILQSKYSTIDEEVLLIKSVCTVLRYIPENIRKIEGLQLVGLLSSRALRSLKNDKEFAITIISLNDTTISQVIAQKVLSTN